MIFTNAVVAVCLVYMILVVAYILTSFCRANRKGKLKYLKNFKRGNFVLIYLAALPLYWLAHVYKGEAIGGGLLLAIKSCVDLVVLKYDYSNALALMNANLFYRVVIDICFVLVAINAVVFTFTLFGQRLSNKIFCRRALRAEKTVFVVGYNQESMAVLHSVKGEKGRAILLGDGGKEMEDETFIARRGCMRFGKGDHLGGLIGRRLKNISEKKVAVVINTGDDEENLILTEQLAALCEKLMCEHPDLDENMGLNAYVFGAPENASAFLHFVEKSKGRIRLINKYKLIANDFADKYPLTKFMTAREIDYDHATVREDVALNVVMIGFGKTNQQVFLTSVADSQFLRRTQEGLSAKRVRYHIYDKKDSRNDKNLNHNYFRYRELLRQIKGRESEYLPLPEEPAEVSFFKTDINDERFYASLRESLSGNGKKAYNYIVLAFGTDVQNLDLADKIAAKLREWGESETTHVFVKIRSRTLSEKVISREYQEEDGFLTFGEEAEAVYDIGRIVGEKAEKMAWMRHLTYTAEYMDGKDPAEIRRAALSGWFGPLRQMQREANVSACLNLRAKLHLLGFDYVPKSSAGEPAEEAFLEKYTAGDPIRCMEGGLKDKKRIEYRNEDFSRDSVRKTFAVQEHQRWNACMIAAGIVPSTKAQIAEENNGKRLDLRRHGCITTFDGLIEFRKIVAERTGRSEEETDVIRYDYQLMDDALWLLGSNGYKIVRKEEKAQ